jgi:transposase
LSECYSQVLQATTLKLVTAYKNFFESRAKYPRFKAKKNRQSIRLELHKSSIDTETADVRQINTDKRR